MIRKQVGPMQWLIAAGYFLVALIVLVNHITSRSESRTRRLAASLVPVYDDVDVLRRQLTEERQKNQEMAGVIRRLQSSILTSNPVPGLPGDVTAWAPAAAESPATAADVVLPSLRVLRSGAAAPDPFVPGKNPYRPFYRAGSGARSAPRRGSETPVYPGLPSLMLGEISRPIVLLSH